MAKLLSYFSRSKVFIQILVGGGFPFNISQLCEKWHRRRDMPCKIITWHMLNAFLPYKQTNINKIIFFQHIKISLIKSGLRVATHTHIYCKLLRSRSCDMVRYTLFNTQFSENHIILLLF